MVTTHTDMGRTHEEAESLQEEHRNFESTAAVSIWRHLIISGSIRRTIFNGTMKEQGGHASIELIGNLISNPARAPFLKMILVLS